MFRFISGESIPDMEIGQTVTRSYASYWEKGRK